MRHALKVNPAHVGALAKGDVARRGPGPPQGEAGLGGRAGVLVPPHALEVDGRALQPPPRGRAQQLLSTALEL